MRVLAAMSGGVDSSVAAALLADQGHDVVGATMKLWGGPSDTGCCSVADVDDARRVAQQLGIDHHVFNFTAEFDRDVVKLYVADHAAGRTPNPCVACNRHLKFDRLLVRARRLGFDAVATGHHARVTSTADGYELRRGVDRAKDQSYVLYMLDQATLARLLLPIGELTKPDVRAVAASLGLRTAAKPDSQDVCFISKHGGREDFLRSRIGLHPGRIIDSEGRQVGTVPAVELVTVGQRRGFSLPSPAGSGGHQPSPAGSGGHQQSSRARRYAIDVDVATATVRVGAADELLVSSLEIRDLSWSREPLPAGSAVEVQTSAHGRPFPATWQGEGRVQVATPIRRVASGQSAALYLCDAVAGGGIVTGCQ